MDSDLALYIDGEWIDAGARPGEPVINPATGVSVAEVPHATIADLDAALHAAQKGFGVWRRTPALARSQILRKAADLMTTRLEHIACILTAEQGKPLAEARSEIKAAIDTIDWFAEEGRRAYGRIVPGRDINVRQMVIPEPVGPVLALTPWNFPALTPARKIAAALGAGCSTIIKASEETPGTCVEIVRAFADAGLPAGVLNLVFGVPAQISEYCLASPVIRKVSFTGSISVGKHLCMLAAKGMKRTTMELGGHAPVIVFDDVDIQRTVELIATFKYRNAGQVCISPTRFFVQNAIYEPFAEHFVRYAQKLRVDDGIKPGTMMGPLANARRVEAMEMFTADAQAHGATVAAGGSRLSNQGFFFAPTVLTDVPEDSRVMTEEPFGPIAAITPFDDFDDVVPRANALPYGLAAYAFTRSNARAMRIADAIEAGMVGVNSIAVSTPETPFGGVKESGHGYESGLEGLEAYLNRKFVSEGQAP